MAKIEESYHAAIGADVIAAESTEEQMREEMNRHELKVTPSLISASLGRNAALRVRSNCAWRLQFSVDGIVPSKTSGFGDATIDIIMNEDFVMPGDAVFLSGDGSIEATVHFDTDS